MKKLPLIVLGLVIAAVVGGVTAAMVGRAKPKAAAAVRQGPPATVELDEFVVNLADMDEQRYLKTVIVLETKPGQDGQTTIKAAMPRVRDAIITTMSRKRYMELQAARGKQILRDAIKQDLNRLLGSQIVTQVYFTSFVMQ